MVASFVSTTGSGSNENVFVTAGGVVGLPDAAADAAGVAAAPVDAADGPLDGSVAEVQAPRRTASAVAPAA